MEMHQIRYFLATCETANFTKAAAQCYVSQPALTKAIRALEEELGGDLFDRRERPLKLTALGLSVQDYFTKLWGLTAEIRDVARLLTQDQDHVFHLGITADLGPHQTWQLCDRLRQHLALGRVTVHIKSQSDLELGLKSGHLHLALMDSADAQPEKALYTPLYEERLMVAMGQDHPLARCATISEKDMKGCMLVERTYGKSYDGLVPSSECHVHMVSDQDLHTLSALKTSRILAFLPESFEDEEGIVLRPFDSPKAKRTIVLAEPPHTTDAGAPYKALRDALVTVLKDESIGR